MNLKKIALFVILADFAAYTVWVAMNGGTFTEIVTAFSTNPWQLQVLLDLVLALSLFSIWLWRDARERGVNPLPWLIATCLVGSIAPLAYLLIRPDAPVTAGHASRARASHAAGMA